MAQLIATICLVLGTSAAVGAIIAGSSLAGTTIEDLAFGTGYSVSMGMEVSNLTPYVLCSSMVTVNSGVVTLQPRSINPNYKEAMVTRKSAYTATGTFGVVSWEIAEISRRVVVMWSVPFDLNVYTSWFAVGITKQNNLYHNAGWADQMYYYGNNEQLGFKRQGLYYSTATLIYSDNGLKISADMTTSYNAVVTVKVEKIG
ncbi:hypothetical protein DPMN_186056 [Dreissena polymorpha]|uniref:Uncharacterized protein n=1 Tax=Dreissena polymorpha TaxID=45954 RepID=A0A9D4I673_DREPO|nr:hypothetical protein DPMN_186056 [Dreissena polymorpha]